jgi:hypothetical protein
MVAYIFSSTVSGGIGHDGGGIEGGGANRTIDYSGSRRRK